MEYNKEFEKELSGKLYQANNQYIHRKITGMDVLISIGGNIANFNGYIQLNESAVILWKTLKEECTISKLAEVLMQQFDITYEQAEEDVTEFLQMLQEHDMVVVK